MYVLADWNTIRMLRALSINGPADLDELAALLGLPRLAVQDLVTVGLTLSVLRSTPEGRFAVDPGVVARVVADHTRTLLGGAA